MASTGTIKLRVEYPTPETLSELFVRMSPKDQAKMLSMVWDGMRQKHGGAHGAAMHCREIHGELDPEARSLLEHLTASERPKGFAFPVNREPNLAELLNAQRYVEQTLQEKHGVDPKGAQGIEAAARAVDMPVESVAEAVRSVIPNPYARKIAEREDPTFRGIELISKSGQRFHMSCNKSPEGGFELYRKGELVGRVTRKLDNGEVFVALESGGITHMEPICDVGWMFAESRVATNQGALSYVPETSFGVKPPADTKVFNVAADYDVAAGYDRRLTEITRAAARGYLDKYYFNPSKSVRPSKRVCPDCNGTGEYRGLMVVEPCRRCCGG
jgi:hypothetical protein